MPRPHHPHHPFGIYLHIPYCASLCPYCDFNSYHSEDPPWAALTQAILNDLAFHAPRFENGELVSIYFGGGTPSLAPPEMIAALIKEISSRFEASPKEITLEANPGTVDNHKIKAFRDAGINRMSFGWQSTHDKTLKLLGRTHTADDGRAALLMARAAGFENLTLDLIFATPGQTIRELEEDLDALIELEPEHISLYALTYHSGTPFYEWRKRGKFRPIEVEVEVEMMELIDERLVREGFEHYEVSNYAQKPKNLRTSLFRARHNSLYWQGAPYLGLGPGAHSFWRDGAIAGQRWAALKKPEDYIAAYNKTLKLETVPYYDFIEDLEPRDLFNERMMLGLRMADGVALDDPLIQHFSTEVERGIKEARALDWLVDSATRIAPTKEGMLHADGLGEIFF